MSVRLPEIPVFLFRLPAGRVGFVQPERRRTPAGARRLARSRIADLGPADLAGL